MNKKIYTNSFFALLFAAAAYSVWKYGPMEAAIKWFGTALMIVQGLALFFTGYQTLIGYLGMRKRKPEALKEPEKKFAVLVCAHNEEAVVGQIVDNLKTIDYPEELYDIYVICDNCTDGTAEVVRQRGGATAMERHDSEKRGKGYGLEWMFERLWEMEKDGTSYDAVVMFDADNLVSKNFLQVINTKLLDGNEAVQAYLDSKNPDDTWVTKSYAFAYWATNRTYQLSRENLGLSAQMGGTGVVVSTKVLKELGWGATSLTEDLEFTQRYILQSGKRVAWAHDAKIYDEKPLSFGASWKQRIRWMQGHSDCMMRYTVPLLKESIKKRKLLHFDSMVYLVQPSRTIIGLTMIFFLALSMFGGVFAQVLSDAWLAKVMLGKTFSKWLYICFLIPSYSLPILGAVLEKQAKQVIFVPIVYLFSLTWIPITLIGLLKRNEKVWSHTKHTRQATEEEMKKLDA